MLGSTADGRLFIAMELLHGESLGERLARRGALPWQEALAIVRGMCAAVDEAHRAGIVHRDLKPANIFLEPWAGGEAVKVLDFGIAKQGAIGDADFEHDVTALTQVGQVIGTLEYMAPEQLIGGAIDARADVFAIGLVLYEMLTGEGAFGESGDDAIAHVTRIVTGWSCRRRATSAARRWPPRSIGRSRGASRRARAASGSRAWASCSITLDVGRVVDDDVDDEVAEIATMPRRSWSRRRSCRGRRW